MKACYNLEGDGLLALSCYEILSSVKASIQVKHWANSRTLAWKIAAECQLPCIEAQLMTYALLCVQPGFTYFESKFGGELLPCAKAASLFHPVKNADRRPDASTVEDLKAFHFLQAAVPDLQKELPDYLAAAEGVAPDIDVLKWWEKQEEKLPHWAATCRQVLLGQPSSAAVERVFSSLQNSFLTGRVKKP